MRGNAEKVFCSLEKVMDVLEDSINSIVAMSTNAPTLDDSHVVAIDSDVMMLAVEDSVDNTNEQVETEGLCPFNVFLSVGGFPTQ